MDLNMKPDLKKFVDVFVSAFTNNGWFPPVTMFLFVLSSIALICIPGNQMILSKIFYILITIFGGLFTSFYAIEWQQNNEPYVYDLNSNEKLQSDGN